MPCNTDGRCITNKQVSRQVRQRRRNRIGSTKNFLVGEVGTPKGGVPYIEGGGGPTQEKCKTFVEINNTYCSQESYIDNGAVGVR